MIQQLIDAVAEHRRKSQSPFYLVVDQNLSVLEMQGEAAAYGFQEARPGASAADELLFLQGSEDNVAPYRLINCIATASGRHADVHVIKMDNAWGLSYFDATADHDRRQIEQQAANELSLLQYRQEQLLDELRQTQNSLSEANQQKGLFIARMSHEFRTPLSSVLGYTDLLAEGLSHDAESVEYLGAITRGANHLLNLVENLVDQARIAQDEIVLYPANVDFRQCISQLREMFQPIADKKGLKLRGSVAEDVPAKIWVDELRLRQILINLIGNATKFTAKGYVAVNTTWCDGQLYIEVVDTGPGIPKALQNRLFEPFRRGGDGGKGAGLGLSISRALARLMNGDLEHCNHAEPGTVMTLRISAPSPSMDDDHTSGDEVSLKGVQVLVVDDDEDLLELSRVLLEKSGANVVTAANGPQTLEHLQREQPDILLVDMHLGNEHGDQLISDARDLGYGNPAILMSATSDMQTLNELYAKPDVAFMAKPLKREELVTLIKRLASHG